MKSYLLFLVVAGLLMSACSELKERPEGPDETDELNVHPAGWLDPADSVNFHGKKIENAGWSFAQCTACHGKDYAGGIAQRACTKCHPGTPEACGTCHRMPPPSPHPPLATCSLCHTRTVDKDRSIVDKTLHMNGRIDVEVPNECNACHGSEQNAAPPRDASGNISATERGVGAHQRHVTQGAIARAFDCTECHVKPSSVADPGHLDSDLPAEVTFGAIARGEGTEKGSKAVPVWDSGALACRNAYCHGAFTNGNQTNQPVWTSQRPSEGTCGTCHMLPPPAPHPPVVAGVLDCVACHPKVVDKDRAITNKSLHVNGKVEIF